MREQTITSLAILKVNWDQGRDYIENFVPFVAECLRKASRPQVSLPELQATVRREFGLSIPQGALKTVLKRAVKRGYARASHGVYVRDDDALRALDIVKVRADVLRQHSSLVQKLVSFCKSRHKIEWSEEEAEAALLSQLQDRSTPVLAAALEGKPIPEPSRSVKHAEFLVSAFILHLSKADPQGFEYLETLVKGSMLAGVLFFPDLGGVTQRFAGVEVYFDTPFLLRALGVTRAARQAPCRELMGLLYELNAELRCFDHTLEEIRANLSVAAHALRDRSRLRYQKHHETLDYFIGAGWKASDVELLIAQLDNALRGLRVAVKQKPPYEVELGLDEVELEETLQRIVGYRSKKALQRDLDSLTAIHRLRRGKAYHHVESCRAILITTNPSLTGASARFFGREQESTMVPHCLLDHIFATLVWLKKPLKAPDLPRKRIIADCYATMNPAESLWQKYLWEIGRLRERQDLSEEDYHLLRFSMEARAALMNRTLGDPDNFAEGTVKEVLEKARATVRREVEADLKVEKKRRLEAERRASIAERRLELLRSGRLDRCRILAAKCGKALSRALMVLGFATLAIGMYMTLLVPPHSLPQSWLRIPVLIALAMTGLLALANLAFGTTLRILLRRVEVSLSKLVESVLLRLFGL